MFIKDLETILRRELLKLKQEIQSYNSEKNLWITDGGIKNSAGNLCLHLLGNLNTYIGKELGGTGYIRNRDLEFSQKDVPCSELLNRIDELIAVVESSLSKVTPEQLEQEYPVRVFDQPLTMGQFLLHLACHLTYHLGQVNYHRRLLDE